MILISKISKRLLIKALTDPLRIHPVRMTDHSLNILKFFHTTMSASSTPSIMSISAPAIRLSSVLGSGFLASTKVGVADSGGMVG